MSAQWTWEREREQDTAVERAQLSPTVSRSPTGTRKRGAASLQQLPAIGRHSWGARGGGRRGGGCNDGGGGGGGGGGVLGDKSGKSASLVISASPGRAATVSAASPSRCLISLSPAAAVAAAAVPTAVPLIICYGRMVLRFLSSDLNMGSSFVHVTRRRRRRRGGETGTRGRNVAKETCHGYQLTSNSYSCPVSAR